MTYPTLWLPEVEARIQREAINLDPQTVPDEVVMCSRCVMTNQRPRITFDEGICSACRFAESQKLVDWDARRNELKDLLNEHRSIGAYDCIIPSSGGKDSAFVASTLRDDYEMHPLCATWAPHIYTDIGRKNFDSFVHSGFDVVTATPNGLVHRKLARLAFEFYGDPFQAFVYGQLAWPFHVAAQNNVNLVFYAENAEAAYGGDTSANDKPRWDEEHWERVYLKSAGIDKLFNLGLELGAFTQDEVARAAPFYRMPQVDRMPEFHWLAYYLPHHPQSNYYHACQRTGFEANDERSEGTYSKYASLDDRLDGLHYRFAFIKFGIGRCTSDASHEVREQDLLREEALSLVARYDHERPVRHLAQCLDYLGMDEEQLERLEDRFRGTQVSLNRAA